MKSLLYIVGEPGIGKSTLMAALTVGHRGTAIAFPVPHLAYDGHTAQIGVVRDRFSGTDGMSMSVQPKVIQWLELWPYRTLLAEGDRLATEGFFMAAVRTGYMLRLVYLYGPRLAEERRQSRAGALGTKAQNEQWVRGRITKVRNLVGKFGHLPINAALSPEDQMRLIQRAGWKPWT